MQIRQKLWPVALVVAGIVLVPTVVGAAVGAFTSTTQTPAVSGVNSATTGQARGVYGESRSPAGRGVMGYDTRASGENSGVWGQSPSPIGRGVTGYATATTGFSRGVFGRANSRDGTGVWGAATSGTSDPEFLPIGVFGEASSPVGVGVWGDGDVGVEGRGDTIGVIGDTGTGGLLGIWSLEDAGLSEHLLGTTDVAGTCTVVELTASANCFYNTPFPDGTTTVVVVTPQADPQGSYWVESTEPEGFTVHRSDGAGPDLTFNYVVVGMTSDLDVSSLAAAGAAGGNDRLRQLAEADAGR